VTLAAARAAVLLLRAARRGGARVAPEPARVGAVACDRYEPRRRPRAVVVALHGVTVNGKDDVRLRAFAAAVAGAGARCLVPTIPGLAAPRRDPADVEAIGAVIEAAAGGGHEVVLAGFSHGASLGLLAAARPAWAGRVRHALCFGAYHDLGQVVRALRDRPAPGAGRDRDDVIYGHLVEARRRADELGLGAADRAAADDLLRRYCAEATDEEKLRFFEAHLAPLALATRPADDAAVLAALSPAGQLAGLRCPVGLVHDPDDRLVPVSEAHALHAELCRVAPARHRLLVTRLVRHVASSGLPRPGEALRLAAMAAPLAGG
jgi:pimeloyl-ACP methyl ester carboxylesterase